MHEIVSASSCEYVGKEGKVCRPRGATAAPRPRISLQLNAIIIKANGVSA
jgi:hypothetical protein